jgi:hypothetical protein
MVYRSYVNGSAFLFSTHQQLFISPSNVDEAVSLTGCLQFSPEFLQNAHLQLHL